MTSRSIDLAAVAESGMCIACGACLAADESLDLVLDERTLTYRPTGIGNPAAAAVCPAVQVDFEALHAFRFPGAEVGPHGVVDSVLLAQSTDHDRNLAASSGGLIKELLLSLLARDDVDGILALDEVGGLDYRVRLVRDPDEIDRLPGSIYHAVRLDDTLRLLREGTGRYVVVGIPCQLEGIFNYVAQEAPELAERIVFTVGLLCGWTYSHHSIEAIARFKRIDPAAIEHVAYRGGGPVGRLKLTTADKEVAIGRRVSFDYQVAFDRSFNTTRCHVCIDHSNFLADIVVGDAWLPSTVFTRTGISLLICRTPEASAMIHELAAAGRLVFTEATTDEITESQTHRVVFGDFAYAYADHRRAIGAHTPVMIGPNRSATTLRPREEAAAFHSELMRKRELQQARRYRYLWLRKATKELPRHTKRYIDWFLVRVLRLKSLKGERTELSRKQMSVFR
jgi:coenzyme F420 hydrogenase subunit beta